MMIFVVAQTPLVSPLISSQAPYQKPQFQQSQGSPSHHRPPKLAQSRKQHQQLLPKQASLNRPLQRELQPLFKDPYHKRHL